MTEIELEAENKAIAQEYKELLRISYQTLTTDVVVESALGYVESDLVFTGVSDIENASYQGNLKANNFHLGKLINEPMVQLVTVDAFFDGKGFNPETGEWKSGFEDQKKEWEKQYSDALAKWQVEKDTKVANPELAALSDKLDSN